MAIAREKIVLETFFKKFFIKKIHSVVMSRQRKKHVKFCHGNVFYFQVKFSSGITEAARGEIV